MRLPTKPAVHRHLFLRRLRTDYNVNALERLPNPARPRRIVTYAITDANGNADRSLTEVRDLVASLGYDVVREVTDPNLRPLRAPQDRDGWAKARRLVHQGRADGIAVVDRNAVSSHDDKYEEEIRWIGQRPGLLLLVMPEAAT
ncbi:MULTISPECIES: hypothetical protein [Streptomyces]